MFSILRIIFVFFITDNPVYDDCYINFNRSGSPKEKHLLFTKCFFYFVSKTVFTFREDKKFGKFRFLSSYSLVVISYVEKSFILTLRKFLTISLIHFDLKIVAIFCLGFDFMLVEENVCFYSFFISDAGLVQYRTSVGVFTNRDNNSKTKYLDYATLLPVLYMLNFPKLYDLIYFFKLLFQVALQLYYYFFFMKHVSMNLFVWEQTYCILMLQ